MKKRTTRTPKATKGAAKERTQAVHGLSDRDWDDAIRIVNQYTHPAAFTPQTFRPLYLGISKLTRFHLEQVAEALFIETFTLKLGEVDRAAVDQLVRELGKSKEGHSSGGRNKSLNSPVGRTKLEVYKLWKERYEGNHQELRRNEDFAREAMTRWPVLTNVGVILGWATEWNAIEEARLLWRTISDGEHPQLKTVTQFESKAVERWRALRKSRLFREIVRDLQEQGKKNPSLPASWPTY